MKKYILVGVLAFVYACRPVEHIDPNLEITSLGGVEYPDMIVNEGQKDEYNLDEWLRETFLAEYNIEVVYRWDAVKMYTGVTKKLVPVKVEKVKPMMETIAAVWFKPFLETASNGFLQKYTPKTVILVGSPEYSSDGSGQTLGTATGGLKVMLFKSNEFTAANKETLKGYMHVVLHEFVHVLNQNLNYDVSFEDISKTDYDPSDWNRSGVYEYGDHDAWRRGFVSNYAMVSPDEDYAETLSMLLVKGRTNWLEKEVYPEIARGKDNTTSSVPIDPTLAQQRIEAKIKHAEAYLQDQFGISLRDKADGTKGLETHVQEAIDRVVEQANENL